MHELKTSPHPWEDLLEWHYIVWVYSNAEKQCAHLHNLQHLWSRTVLIYVGDLLVITDAEITSAVVDNFRKEFFL